MALLKPCLSARLPILIRSGICSGLERGFRRRRLHSGSSWSAAARAAMEDFEFREGPLEPIRPKFNRSPYAPSQLEPEKTTPASSDARPNRRRFRKPTPLQAMVGAVVGGGWTVIAFQVTHKAYNHLQQHPPAHDLPLGLTADVNQLLLTMVAGFGGLAVCMFGVSSLGLTLLCIKLGSTPKPPLI